MAARLSCIKREYIEDTLKCFGMTKSKPVNTSMDPSMKLTLPEDASDIQKLPYHELIETLTYLVVATRPDIAFIVSAFIVNSLNQFNSYSNIHWTATRTIMHYYYALHSGQLRIEHISIEDMTVVMTKVQT